MMRDGMGQRHITALTVQETLEKTVQMQPRWVDAFKGFQGLNTALHTHGIRTLDTTPTSSRSRTARASLECGVRDGSVLGSVGTFANTWSSAEKSGIKNHRSTSCAIFHDSSIESFRLVRHGMIAAWESYSTAAVDRRTIGHATDVLWRSHEGNLLRDGGAAQRSYRDCSFS